MITKLYMDNYKGFTNTLIEIDEVNFLVGDNSTGKTTLMNLLYILDSTPIPFKIDLNDKIRLGGFKEIVNKYSSDNSYFAFGCENEFGKKKVYQFWRFINKDGFASLQEYRSYKGGQTVRMILDKDNELQLAKKEEAKDISFDSWVHQLFNKENISIIDSESEEFRSLLFEVLLIKEESVFTSYVENRMLLFSPIRAQAKPFYDNFDREFSPEGSHTASFLKSCIEKKSKKSKEIISMINEFALECSLFEDIEVEKLSDKSDSIFSIDVKYGTVKINISNVGFGVSQVMPLIVEMLRRENSQIAIPQPEVHLHPKAQSAFGTFVFKNWNKNKNRYILETHSDYMINRFRYELSKAKKKPIGKSQVLFFERNENGNFITSLPIGNDGNFSCEVPNHYGDFFIDEELKMLEL